MARRSTGSYQAIKEKEKSKRIKKRKDKAGLKKRKQKEKKTERKEQEQKGYDTLFCTVHQQFPTWRSWSADGILGRGLHIRDVIEQKDERGRVGG